MADSPNVPIAPDEFGNNPNGIHPQANNSPCGSPFVFANEEELLGYDLLDLQHNAVPTATMPDGRKLILPSSWLADATWMVHMEPVPCLQRWLAYFSRFIDPATGSKPPHPDAFEWPAESRPWGHGTFRDSFEVFWFLEAGMDPETQWPFQQPRQDGLGAPQEQIPEDQFGAAQSALAGQAAGHPGLLPDQAQVLLGGFKSYRVGV